MSLLNSFDDGSSFGEIERVLIDVALALHPTGAGDYVSRKRIIEMVKDGLTALEKLQGYAAGTHWDTIEFRLSMRKPTGRDERLDRAMLRNYKDNSR